MGIVLWLPCIFLISEAFPSLFFWKRRYEFSYKKISSRHSHNGGRWIWKEDKRLNKSSLKFPLTISCSKSRFVATITRTSTCIRVSTTNFHKLPGLKNTQQPGLQRNIHFSYLIAPAKKPAVCPNISLSSKSLLKEEQFIATKVYPLRWLSLWIRRAKTYFLVPVSPVCNTDASVFATFWANETASNIAGDLPIIFLSVIVFR